MPSQPISLLIPKCTSAIILRRAPPWARLTQLLARRVGRLVVAIAALAFLWCSASLSAHNTAPSTPTWQIPVRLFSKLIGHALSSPWRSGGPHHLALCHLSLSPSSLCHQRLLGASACPLHRPCPYSATALRDRAARPKTCIALFVSSSPCYCIRCGAICVCR
uniref:Uncharacterized protein n=1 Tax=Zea mays TaxID=4577 RepID=A0A804NMX6_MAIZE